MLLSMTGYGEATYQGDRTSLRVELRSVNNRHLKVSLRTNEPYNTFEPDVERVIRRTIRRGTVQVALRVERKYLPSDYRLNSVALRSYMEQVQKIGNEIALDPMALHAVMGQTVTLPGVAPQPGDLVFDRDEEWQLIERVIEDAVGRLQTMRRDEGKRMAQELLASRSHIARQLDHVRERIPTVVLGYRDRLLERVRQLLVDAKATIEPDALIREVSVFAERSDIAEEVVRLSSHLEQFQEVVERETDAPGRKLEFVVQEMGRETNTIGSKASDVMISRHVVEIKATLERIRELIQNVE